jgi:hypothetical protein
MTDFKNFMKDMLFDSSKDLMKYLLQDDEGMVLIEKWIQILFDAMKKTNDIKEADCIFNNLNSIQFILTSIVFTDNLPTTPFLANFIYDFERIDDDDVKRYQYNKIRNQAL